MNNAITTQSRTGPELRALRRAYGITQAEIAARLGITRITVSIREARAAIDESVYLRHKQAVEQIHEEKKNAILG